MTQTDFFEKFFEYIREFSPIVKIQNVEFDFSTNTVILNNPTVIRCKENLYISSDKHLFLDSGKDFDYDNNILYSIFENTDKDQEGNPVLEDIDVRPIKWSVNNTIIKDIA